MAKIFDREDEPNEYMDMPCQCDCGLWFDLNDGHRINSKPNQVVCGECAESEKADEEKEQEIENFKSALDDAYFTIKDTGEAFRLKYPDEFEKYINLKDRIDPSLLP